MQNISKIILKKKLKKETKFIFFYFLLKLLDENALFRVRTLIHPL